MMMKNFVRQLLFCTAGAVILAPQNALAENIWFGLPDLPDVVDVANWMTPQKAQHFSQGVHTKCSSQEVLNKYYYNSLPICNAYQTWYDAESKRLVGENRRLDRILACQRSGNKYCY